MLAFRLPLPTKYDWPTALLSFGIAMAGAAVHDSCRATSPPVASQTWDRAARSAGRRCFGRRLHRDGLDAYVCDVHLLSAARDSPPRYSAVGFSLLSLRLVFALRSPWTWRRLRQIGAGGADGRSDRPDALHGHGGRDVSSSGTPPDWFARGIHLVAEHPRGGRLVDRLAGRVASYTSRTIIDQRWQAGA